MTKYKDTSYDWLNFAKIDLGASSILLHEGSYTTASFHAQQATEKLLKAYLRHKDRRVPKTHKLITLLVIVEKAGLKEIDPKDIAFLDKFYTPTRYPDAYYGSLPRGLPTRKEAEKALEIAEEIFEIIKGLIPSKTKKST